MKIKICDEFTNDSGFKYMKESPYSAGRIFSEQVLIPKFKESIEKSEILIIDLNGGYGYTPQFLEEAFGRLSKEFGSTKVKRNIIIKSDDEFSLYDDILKYINKY